MVTSSFGFTRGFFLRAIFLIHLNIDTGDDHTLFTPRERHPFARRPAKLTHRVEVIAELGTFAGLD